MRDRSKIETEVHKYLARDGYWYNGYFGSNDLVEDSYVYWRPVEDAICKNIKEDIREELSAAGLTEEDLERLVKLNWENFT